MDITAMHPGWAVQLAIHRAVRRDTARLCAALADGRTSRPDAVRAYWADTSFQLHDHHVLEDTVVWPLMAERLGDPVAALLTRNANEHRAMAAAMDRFNTVVTAMHTGDESARVALGQMEEAVETHLAHEEADVLPLIAEAFTLDDVAFFSAESAKTNPPRAFLPWVLDDAPDDVVAFFTRHMPAAVRAELDSSWMPRRRRTVDGLALPTSLVAAP
jgi:hypothetical protein